MSCLECRGRETCPAGRDPDVQRQSAAVSLSDMEVFLFPELIYSLVLANMVSPRLWAWREDPWFEGYLEKSPYQRLKRLKQFIMDHYTFNLDLDTWGLTTKERELARFSHIIDEEVLARSNALFGYEGDQYYFDIDIRRHFGLDQYEGNVIPYWKTETVEAMDAFRHRPGHRTGAGECVSLSTLYAAAAFVVARIPLADIYLMATPLHSQNFLDVEDGVLTNNRRLVTKAMWFNGTELSDRARRALANERVTVVAHQTGWIHTIYDEATIAPEAYERFAKKLRAYLTAPLTAETFGNFLRQAPERQTCFQLRVPQEEGERYLPLETAFAREGDSPYLLTDNTREKLLAEIEPEAFWNEPLADRLTLDDLEETLDKHKLDLRDPEAVERLRRQVHSTSCLPDEVTDEVIDFLITAPRLPQAERKTFAPEPGRLALDPAMEREEILAHLQGLRESNRVVDLAFYARRDLNATAPEPFLLAAVERNPVSVCEARPHPWPEVVRRVKEMPNESIYDEPGRLAQPDEVWNFGRGDGAERAVLLANLLRGRHPDATLVLRWSGAEAVVESPVGRFAFPSHKQLRPLEWVVPEGCQTHLPPCRAQS
jgi:hypothetical protein